MPGDVTQLFARTVSSSTNRTRRAERPCRTHRGDGAIDDPGGMKDISPGLSEATPPDPRVKDALHPGRGAREWRNMPSWVGFGGVLWHPSRVRIRCLPADRGYLPPSGINPRLMSGNPPVCSTKQPSWGRINQRSDDGFAVALRHRWSRRFGAFDSAILHQPNTSYP